MFTMCASMVSTNAEHYDLSLKVIQVQLGPDKKYVCFQLPTISKFR